MILVVDDNVDSRRVLAEFLRLAGYQIRQAGDGRTALDIAKQEPIELVLFDIRLPDIDGFEICRQLIDDSLLDDFPVILISGLADLPSKIKGFEHGAIDYISKPFQRQEVLSRVRTHLDLHHLRQSLSRMVEKRTNELCSMVEQLKTTNLKLYNHKESQSRILNSLFEGGIAISPQGRCIFANLSSADLLGFDHPDELIGHDICQIHPSWDRWFAPVLQKGYSLHEKDYQAAYRANMAGGNNYRSDIDFIGFDGRNMPVDCKVSIVENANREFEAVVSFIDITERKKRELDLFNLAHEDPLTGLPNRRAFHQRMDDIIQEANQYYLPAALFIIDLDYFKEINDTFGHC